MTRVDPTESGPAIRRAVPTARSRRRRWLSAGAILVFLLAQTAVQAVGQPPASALPGAVVDSEVSLSNSEPTKAVSAFCPPGRRVTGGSGQIIGGTGQVVLTRMQPVHTNNLDRFEVVAAEDQGGFNGNWSVRAYVICASPITGMTITESVVEAEPTDPFLAVFATANCPGGTRSIGGGGRITSGHGQVQLRHSQEAGVHHVAAGVVDADGAEEPWSVTAYAVCAPLSADQVTLVQAQTSPPDSTSPKSQSVDCPPGMLVSGVGGSVSIGTPDLPLAFESLVPEVGAQQVPGNTVTVTARETSATDENWSVRATAYCVS
jgi:hypothetical protein